MAKLKNILQEVFEDSPQVDKYKVVELDQRKLGLIMYQLLIYFNYANHNVIKNN